MVFARLMRIQMKKGELNKIEKVAKIKVKIKNQIDLFILFF